MLRRGWENFISLAFRTRNEGIFSPCFSRKGYRSYPNRLCYHSDGDLHYFLFLLFFFFFLFFTFPFSAIIKDTRARIYRLPVHYVTIIEDCEFVTNRVQFVPRE